MNSKGIIADFQFLGNRVSKLVLDTRMIEGNGRAEVSFDFDYEIKDMVEEEKRFLGIIQVTVKGKAKVKNRNLFRIDLEMEGAFAGNADRLTREKFTEMLEMNGLITLLHMSRAYLLSVTAQSGINPPVKVPMVNVLKLREKKAQAIENKTP